MKLLKKRWINKKRIAYITIIFLLLVFIIDKLGITRRFLLRVYEPIETSRIILCEGWLPIYYFDTVKSIFNDKPYEKLVVTGISNSRYVYLPENGKLFITKLNPGEDTDNHTKQNINLDLSGSKANDEYTKVNIFFNDSVLYDSLELLNEKSIAFSEYLSPEDTITIEFYNDYYDGVHDRNLYLRGIRVNEEEVKTHSDKVWLNYRGRFINTEKQFYPRSIFKFLLTQDNENNNIVFVDSDTKGLSRTFNTAHGAVTWLNENGYKEVNIVTLDFHSRRTYMTFRKIDPNLKVGIIPIPNATKKSRLFSKARTFKEIFGCIFIYITPEKLLERRIGEDDN